MCGTNAGSQLKLVNGVDVGTATGGTGGVSLFVNAGYASAELSDFAIAEVVVWPRGLTGEEMHRVSDHLMASPPSPPPPPLPSVPRPPLPSSSPPPSPPLTATCADGYAGDGVTCSDINECDLGTHACDSSPSPVDGSPLATCTNTAGGYTCACTTSGYAGDGFYCADINECTLSTHDCHADGTCSNTYGNWSCGCDAGYEGNGAAWVLTLPDA